MYCNIFSYSLKRSTLYFAMVLNKTTNININHCLKKISIVIYIQLYITFFNVVYKNFYMESVFKYKLTNYFSINNSKINKNIFFI